MAQNVVINGVTYQSVPYVDIPHASPLTGDARFVDTESGDAVAGDIRSGKKAWVDGVEVTGTIAEKTASDVGVSGKTVSIPAGIYDDPVSKSVADGVITPNATVTGNEISTESVTDYEITVQPSASVTAGYVNGNATGTAYTAYIQVESASVTPSTSPQTITPTSGKLIKQVNVSAVDLTATATEANVPAGVTFFANSLVRKTGTGQFPTVSQDSTTHSLRIS